MKSKKDILFLCQYFYPEYVSSATLPFDTAQALVRAGFRVSTLCGYPKEYNKQGTVPLKEIHEGIDIKRIKYLQFARSNFLGRLVNYFSFTLSIFFRFFSLKNYKSIIVYSNPPILPLVAALASKYFGAKVVFVSYDLYPDIAIATKSISENGFIAKLMNLVNKITFNNLSKVVSLSTEMKEYLLSNRAGLTEKQVQVIPNWYEDKINYEISSSYSKEKFTDFQGKEKLVVSYFGNMGICQDLETILEAIRLLKDENAIKFMFAGHGVKLDRFKKAIQEEHLNNVIVFDFLHGDDFQTALNLSNCFLVSLEDGLNGMAVPSKTYSYMMAGKPVIAIMDKNSEISQDLVKNHAGFTVEVGDAIKLVESIISLKSDVALRTELGKNIRKVYEEKYTTEICTSKYVELMKKVLKEK